jgi:hypothetical protein
MGAFNAWVAGSSLEPLEQRTVARLADELLRGARIVARLRELEGRGVALDSAAWTIRPQ